MSRRPSAPGGALLVLAASLLLPGCGPRAITAGSAPFPAPRPVLSDGAGNLLADLPPPDSDVRLVVIEAPWCTPCEGVWEAVARAVEPLPPGTVKVYRLLLDRERLLEDPERSAEVPPLRPPPPPGTVAAETFHVMPGPFQESFEVERVPLALLLDRKGTVRSRWAGFHPALADEMGTAIRRLAPPAVTPAPGR